MAAGRLIVPAMMPAEDSNGARYGYAKLWTYADDTTTLKTTYADESLTIPNTNPVVANSAGQFPPIWANASSPVLAGEYFNVAVWTQEGEQLATYSHVSPTLDADTAAVVLAEAAAVVAVAAADSIIDSLPLPPTLPGIVPNSYAARDTNAAILQAAITVGGEYRLPDQTIYYSRFTVPENTKVTRLIGSGGGMTCSFLDAGTQLRFTGTGSQPAITMRNPYNFYSSDISWTYEDDAFTGPIFDMSCDGSTWNMVRFARSESGRVGGVTYPAETWIYGHNLTDVGFEDCRFAHTQHAFVPSRAADPAETETPIWAFDRCTFVSCIQSYGLNIGAFGKFNACTFEPGIPIVGGPNDGLLPAIPITFARNPSSPSTPRQTLALSFTNCSWSDATGPGIWLDLDLITNIKVSGGSAVGTMCTFLRYDTARQVHIGGGFLADQMLHFVEVITASDGEDFTGVHHQAPTGEIFVGKEKMSTFGARDGSRYDVGTEDAANALTDRVGEMRCLYRLKGANMKVTTDQIFEKVGVWKTATLQVVKVNNASRSLTDAVGGIYSAPSKGGVQLTSSAQAYSALTDAARGLSSNFNDATGLGLKFYADNYYLSLTTPQSGGAAATADFYIFGYVLS